MYSAIFKRFDCVNCPKKKKKEPRKWKQFQEKFEWNWESGCLVSFLLHFFFYVVTLFRIYKMIMAIAIIIISVKIYLLCLFVLFMLILLFYRFLWNSEQGICKKIFHFQSREFFLLLFNNGWKKSIWKGLMFIENIKW